jgi:hypothetical protein
MASAESTREELPKPSPSIDEWECRSFPHAVSLLCSQTNPKETLNHVHIEIFVWSKCPLLRQSIRFRDSSNRSSSSGSPLIPWL